MTTDRNSGGAVAWKDKAGTVWPDEYNWAAQFSQLSPGAGFVSMDAGKVYGLARAYAASIPAAEVLALVERMDEVVNTTRDPMWKSAAIHWRDELAKLTTIHSESTTPRGK